LLLLALSFPLARWGDGGERPSRTPQGYYAQLTEAFLAGQLHLKQVPDPRLAALANPYAGEQGVPRPWDVSYYQNRFYLYFSAAPVLLFFAPVRLLTGYYLPDGYGTAFFGLVGFGVGAWFLLRQQRRLLPALADCWVIAGLGVWCFSSHAHALTHFGSIYMVPINAAFACLAAAIACFQLAWENPGRLRWLVAGGLAWGLAVACRPNYLFSLAGLPVFLAGVWLRNRSLPPGRRSRLFTLGLAAGLPVCLVGVALMAYNWARFGSVTEFGASYQLLAGDQRNFAQLDVGRIPVTILPTLTRPMQFSTYFPYVLPANEGVLWSSPLLLALLALPALWQSRRPEERGFWRVTGGAILVAGLANFTTVCMLLTQEFRYSIDYLPPLVLLAVLVTWRLVHPSAGPQSGWARARRAALGLATAVTLLHALALEVVILDLPRRAPTTARWLNYPTHWAELAAGYRYGPLRMTGRLPALSPGTALPLVVTARGRDVLYARYPAPGQIQFGFFHAGAGGPESLPIEFDPSRQHVFEFDLGSLYPPREHPLFAGRAPREIKILQKRVRVTVDGQVALDGFCDFYPSHPLDVRIGENPNGLVTGSVRLARAGFTVERLGLSALPPAAAHPLKPVRLELVFPPFVHFKREPLVSTGHSGAGDLLYVIFSGPDKLQFAHDSWGAGSIESRVVTYEPGRAYTLEVDMGSLQPHPAGTWAPGRLQVQLDGNVVLSTSRPFHASSATELAFGYNATESTAAYPLFTGQIRKITPVDALGEPATQYGALRCSVQFPADSRGSQEPLLLTGRTGAADAVYVIYAEDGTVRFGYDHWGVGGPLGEPVTLDRSQAHEVEISLGSLWPPLGDDAAWGGLAHDRRRELLETVTVRIDGRTVLQHRGAAHPSRPEEIAIGANPVGASTCGPVFTGRILSSSRTPPVGP